MYLETSGGIGEARERIVCADRVRGRGKLTRPGDVPLLDRAATGHDGDHRGGRGGQGQQYENKRSAPRKPDRTAVQTR